MCMQLNKIKILHTCCTRVVRVALVLHSCHQCSTPVALMSHTCRSCLTHVALVLLVSHSCCIHVTRVTLVSLVSGTSLLVSSPHPPALDLHFLLMFITFLNFLNLKQVDLFCASVIENALKQARRLKKIILRRQFFLIYCIVQRRIYPWNIYSEAFFPKKVDG